MVSIFSRSVRERRGGHLASSMQLGRKRQTQRTTDSVREEERKENHWNEWKEGEDMENDLCAIYIGTRFPFSPSPLIISSHLETGMFLRKITSPQYSSLNGGFGFLLALTHLSSGPAGFAVFSKNYCWICLAVRPSVCLSGVLPFIGLLFAFYRFIVKHVRFTRAYCTAPWRGFSWGFDILSHITSFPLIKMSVHFVRQEKLGRVF